MKLAITMTNGGVAIMTLLGEEPDVERNIRLWIDANPGRYASHRELGDGGQIQQDRTFRDAWEDVGGAIVVSMPRARDLWRDKMRHARAGKLAALDTEYLRADEMKNAEEKLRIAARKKELRDVTAVPEIEAAKNTDELKAVWPDVLK